MNINIIIGEGIKNLREEQGMGQAEFGELCGFSKNRMGRIERGEGSVPVDILQEITNALGMTLAEFFTRINL